MIATDLLAWLIESTAATTAALLLVLLLRAPVRMLFGARVVYALWALLPLSLLAVSLPAPVRDALLPVSVLTAPYQIAHAVTVGAAQPLDATGGRSATQWAWPLLLWFSGGLACAALFARQQRRFVARLGRLSRRGGDLLHAEHAACGPVVVGAWSPRIVLPADFDARYPAPESELVLAHERAHLARGDTRVNLLAVALRCTYWFNPLLHWAAARFRNDQEIACDAIVLARHPHSRRAYAAAMLKTQLAVLGLPVGCHWQSSQSLKERILMLKRPIPGRTRLRLGAIAVASMVLGTSFAVWAIRSTPADTGREVSRTDQPVAVGAGSGDLTQPVVDGIASAAGREARPRMMFTAGPAMNPEPGNSTPAPPYPRDALARKQGGRVLLHVLVSTSGSVKDVRVVESEPQGVFDAVSIEAAKQWKLQPQLEDGKPVEAWKQVPVTFEPDRKKPPSATAPGQA